MCDGGGVEARVAAAEEAMMEVEMVVARPRGGGGDGGGQGRWRQASGARRPGKRQGSGKGASRVHLCL